MSAQIERGHLVRIPDQQNTVRERGMVPGLAADDREARELVVALRRGTEEREVTVLGEDDEVVADGEDLTVAVAAALPLEIARAGVDAAENALVEAVDVPVDQDGAREAVLHSGVAPDLLDGE